MELFGSKKQYYDEISKMKKTEALEKLSSCIIDGKWGSGKSVFVDEIAKLMKEQKDISVLVVDTWKYEYLTSPERMIMVECLKKLEFLPQKELVYSLSKASKKAFKKWIETTDNNDFKIERIIKGTYKVQQGISKNSLYKKNLKLLEELEDSLIDREILKYLNIDIIIFDELDRVLPETLIEILKFTKYFNDEAETVKISACMNTEQCNAMIKHVYGETFSSTVYLDKVFSQQINILNPSADKSHYIYEHYKKEKFEVSWSKFIEINGKIIEYENLKELILSYYLRKHNKIPSFGFKGFELRDISQFIQKNIEYFNLEVNKPLKSNDLLDVLEKKLMLLFYIEYCNANLPHVYEKIEEEYKQKKVNSTFKFEDKDIDVDIIIDTDLNQLLNLYFSSKKEGLLAIAIDDAVKSYQNSVNFHQYCGVPNKKNISNLC